jgi:hypothetical protein
MKHVGPGWKGPRGYDVAVVWSRYGGISDRGGDALYLSDQASTESGARPKRPQETPVASMWQAMFGQ